MSDRRALAVLAMDEHELIADAIGRGPRQAGHEVTTVRSVSEVEDAVRGRHFDFLVLDGTVGNETTVGLCRLLRRRGFLGTIVIQSGEGRPDRIQAFVEAGADDYVFKPWTSDELWERIQLTLAARYHARDIDREGGDIVRDSARGLTEQAARIVRDLRPINEVQSEERSIGDNNPPSDLPLTAKQADDLLEVLREISERLNDASATAKSDTEGRLAAVINRLSGWLGKKLDVAAEEAFKTGGKLVPAALLAHVTHLQELLIQLLAHLKVTLGH